MVSTVVLLFLMLPFVTQAATATITASPDTVYTGGEVTITWSSSGAFRCVGTGFSTGNATSGTTVVTTTSSGVKTYSVSCYDDTPSCSLVETTSYIDDYQAPNTCNSNISYSPSGSCYPKNATCSSSTPRGSGTYTNKEYQCQGGCSVVAASDQVTVNTPPPPPDPSATLSASPSTVTSGNATLISWTSERATSCQGTGFSTGGDTSGSVSVTPSGSTTYSITCNSEVYSSTPGTWEYAYQDTTDLWCIPPNQPQTGYGNHYLDNQCPNNTAPSGSCVGSQTCTVNTWKTTQGGNNGPGDTVQCNLQSDVYQCNGGSAPNQITDSVTVTANGAPNVPTISGPTTGIANTSYTFTFLASDPESDNVRYRIDWDPSTSIDENSAYSTSNWTYSTTRSWSSPGTYSFRARTQDANDAQSGYATHTITIGSGLPACSDGIDNDGDGLIDYPADAGCGSGSGVSESPNPECSDGIDNDGNGQTDYPADAGCSSAADDDESANAQCADGIDNDGDGNVDLADAGCSSAGDNSEGSPQANLESFDVSPNLVRSGDRVTVSWAAENVQSCTATGTNGDAWSGTSGTHTSSALTSETTFRLVCVDLEDETVSASETVKIVPSFQEI